MRVDMCTGMCVDMHMGMCIDKCTGMCVEMCIDMRLPRHLGVAGSMTLTCTHVYKHASTQFCTNGSHIHVHTCLCTCLQGSMHMTAHMPQTLYCMSDTLHRLVTDGANAVE